MQSFPTIYKELRNHRKLAGKRHPMFEHNRFARIFIYAAIIFWAGYLMLIGTMFPFAFEDKFPNMEAYHILHKGAIYILLIDFITRFSFQKIPMQEFKPYQLLPIPRKRILDSFLLQSAFSSFNIFWFFLLVPFGFLSLFRFYGFIGITGFLLGWWLLFIFNNYWYLLCRTLINEKIYFIFIPLSVYALWGVIDFIPNGNILSTSLMNFCEGFILWNHFTFISLLAGILIMFWAVRKVESFYIYKELGRTENKQLRKVSEYKFLDRFGELGEYLRLEIKLNTRNKMVRSQFITGMVCMLSFSLILSTSEVYDGIFMKSFICIYCFVVLGVMTLSRIMSVEGNYLDGLMSRKESILILLKAKYCFNCAILIIPFLLIQPAVFTEKISMLMAVSYMCFAAGPVYAMLFQLAVYNKKTLPLNTKIVGKNSGNNFFQSLVTTTALFLPVGIDALLSNIFGEKTGLLILLSIGILFILLSPLWLRNIYSRFMKIRYENMAGFRDSK